MPLLPTRERCPAASIYITLLTWHGRSGMLSASGLPRAKSPRAPQDDSRRTNRGAKRAAVGRSVQRGLESRTVLTSSPACQALQTTTSRHLASSGAILEQRLLAMIARPVPTHLSRHIGLSDYGRTRYKQERGSRLGSWAVVCRGCNGGLLGRSGRRCSDCTAGTIGGCYSWSDRSQQPRAVSASNRRSATGRPEHLGQNAATGQIRRVGGPAVQVAGLIGTVGLPGDIQSGLPSPFPCPPRRVLTSERALSSSRMNKV